MPIHQLSPDVAAKIAAGEVVERPASVVKELIENSIDAGATQIRVDLMNGGLQLIRVSDNGSGIPAEELALALSRHATSKVAQIDDLEHIRSLGFRGEALASIAAVAEVTLLSRHRGASQGAQVSASNGHISEVSTAPSPEGTVVTVRNLFSSVPARLKFLKSRNTEVSHCHHLLEQYALAYPEIRFSVCGGGRQIFATPGDGQLFSALIEVYGLQVAEQMVPISSLDGTEKDDDPERPVVTGYVSRPAWYKSTRQHMSFFVNRRWVMSRMLSYAVEEAYHSLLLTGRHPIAVVNIQLDPALIDVNVHPAKTEIRFLKERRVYSAVQRAVRGALLEEPQMPEWSKGKEAVEVGREVPQGRDWPSSSPGRGSPQPLHIKPQGSPLQADDIGEDEDILPIDLDVVDIEAKEEGIDTTSVPALPQDNPWVTVTEEESGTKPPMLSRLWQSHVRRPEAGENVSSNLTSPTNLAPTRGATTSQYQEAPENVVAPLVGARLPPSDNLVPAQPRRLPPLRVIGQLVQSYIVTEGPDGMYLIDQHAAHERILLERMVAAMKARTPIAQLLLTPMNLSLAPSELEAIEEHQQQLTQIGFSFEMTESNTLAVLAVPSILVKHMNTRSLHELLVELTALDNLVHTETWEERALANGACNAATKATYFLTVSEMREMLTQLAQTKAPYSCCHGRPTMVHFGLSALAHQFERR